VAGVTSKELYESGYAILIYNPGCLEWRYKDEHYTTTQVPYVISDGLRLAKIEDVRANAI
jgi:hypothetical protein